MDVLKTKDGLANSLNNLNQPAQAAALFQVLSNTSVYSLAWPPDETTLSDASTSFVLASSLKP